MDCGRITNSVLHWNYRGFTEFPLKRLQGEEDEITDIYLKENLISRIPSDIGKLNNLESLYLSGNDITELPREISKLTRLKCLDLSGNRLRYIPDDIGDVRNLKFLILDENELRELPLRIAELRTLRYLSVCDVIEIPLNLPLDCLEEKDNALQWLPQRPVYNYYHCEFRFWRNSSLKTIPYSLWYHMFRGQQTRSLDIGCLSPLKHQGSHSARCVLQLNQYFTGCNLDLNFPTKYNHIFDKGSAFVPSLFELSKRKFYEIINESAKKFFKAPLSIYTDFYHTDNFENNYNIRDIQESLNGFNINNNNNNVKYNSNDQRTNEIDNLILSTKRKGGCEPKDIIEEYFDYLPRFIRDDLCNGPLSRCENVRCKKPIFDFVYYEFCVEKLILIEATEDIILSAAFCSKSCAEAWKPGKAILHWKFV